MTTEVESAEPETNAEPVADEGGGESLSVSVGELLSDGIRGYDDDAPDAPEDDIEPPLAADGEPEPDPETPPEPEPPPEPKPDEKPELTEDEQIEEALKAKDPRAARAHKLARKKHQRLRQQESQLGETEARLAQEQQKLAQQQQQLQQAMLQQQQFVQQLSADPIAALKSIGQDPENVLQQMSRQIIDGEPVKPQPWEEHIKRLEDKLAERDARDQEAMRVAQEQQRQRELAGHFNTVVGRMVQGPELDDFKDRWPTYQKLTPVHREREAREALRDAYQQGYEGPIHELLDLLEESVAQEYPYLVSGNGAGAGNASGRDDEPRVNQHESSDGNGSPATPKTPPAKPDAVTGDMAAEVGSGNRRTMTERQRRATAARLLSEGIIRE